MNIQQTPQWRKLVHHTRQLQSHTIRDLFAEDPQRFRKFSIEAAGILLDYSKNLLTEKTRALLTDLAEELDLAAWTDRMFTGEHINVTEDRAVLHTALRNPRADTIQNNSPAITNDILAVSSKIRLFSEAVRSGTWKGFKGDSITDVVTIGIGGSNLGPAMVTEALTPFCHDRLSMHFVSNVDGTHIAETCKKLRPDTTLFIIASKTFTTLETMTNAATAKRWFLKNGGCERDIARHFVAISTNTEAVRTFGINPDNMFVFWDWVGGRYSVWSAIGLPVVIAVGMERFEDFLAGARAMDEHFRSAAFEKNIPVMLALTGVLYNNFLGCPSHAILPYDQYLRRLPAYIQQLDMESNGKRVQRNGETVAWHTGPIIWGEPGTDGQHAFYQLLHQGTRCVPADFIAPANSHHDIGDHHRLLLSNFFAQTEALMNGKTVEQVKAEMVAAGYAPKDAAVLAPHRTFPGNRPSNSIMVDTLTPNTLGALIAMYEHKIFVQGIVWGICSFDQWGVELGKQLAKQIIPELSDDRPVTSHDSSTNSLIHFYKTHRRQKH